VTVTQRDIEEGGFPEEMHGQADGVFLDLPKPYKVRAIGMPLPADQVGALGAA